LTGRDTNLSGGVSLLLLSKVWMTRDWVLCYDSTLACWSLLVQQLCAKHGIVMLTQHCTLPVLTPWIFSLPMD